MPSCLAYNFLARLFLSSAKTRSRLFYDADYIPSSFTNTTLSQHTLSALFSSWSCSFALCTFVSPKQTVLLFFPDVISLHETSQISSFSSSFLLHSPYISLQTMCSHWGWFLFISPNPRFSFTSPFVLINVRQGCLLVCSLQRWGRHLWLHWLQPRDGTVCGQDVTCPNPCGGGAPPSWRATWQWDYVSNLIR